MNRCKCGYVDCALYWPNNGQFVNGTGFDRYEAVKVENVGPLFDIAFEIAFEYSRMKPKDWLALRAKATEVVLRIQKDAHDLERKHTKIVQPLKEV